MNGLQEKKDLSPYAVPIVGVPTGTKKKKERRRLRARAGYLVHKALREGTLDKKPCEICGCRDSEAHHDDYNKPLDVVWLCVKHHAQRHNYLGRGKKLDDADPEWKAWAITVVNKWIRRPRLLVPKSWAINTKVAHRESLRQWLWEFVDLVEKMPGD